MMAELNGLDPQSNAATDRLIRREAPRRATAEPDTTPKMESMTDLKAALARISAEITTEAAVEIETKTAGTQEVPALRPARRRP
jgi:hypothetical protein